MSSTIKMIRHKFDKGIEIVPISDLHVGSKEFEEGLFQKLSREILASENTYCVIIGDLVDNGIKSSVTSPYEAVMQPNDQRKYAAELLYPLKDRILCMVSGNHEYRSRKDTDTDPAQLIAERLNIEHLFRADMAFMDIKCGERPNGRTTSPRYCVGVTHGAGGGMLIGSGLNKQEPFAMALGIDLMITGHTHRPMTAPSIRYTPDFQKGVMVPREMRLLISTGFLSYGGYPTRKMLKPVCIRPNRAILSGTEYDISVLS